MIEVRITAGEVLRSTSRGESVEQGAKRMVLGKLRDAGAPVEGYLLPELKTGVLTRFDDCATGDIVYRWRPA